MAKTSGKKKVTTKKKFTKTHKNELIPSKLRWTCPETKFKFKTTREVKPLDNIVGQPRAIEAIRLGAELFAKGYNIFVTGLSGTGRFTTVKSILREVTTQTPRTNDYCYVNNFDNSDTPRLIKLVQGQGKQFAKAMDEAVTFLRRRLPKLFEEETFQSSRRKIVESFQKQEREILSKFDEKIKPHGFVRGQIENEQGLAQPEVFPLVGDKPVQVENLDEYVTKEEITEEKAEELKRKIPRIS